MMRASSLLIATLLVGLSLPAEAVIDTRTHPAFSDPATCELPERKRQATMGERTYRRLTSVHELMGEGEYAEAMKRVDSILDDVDGGYERAIASQTKGFLHAQQEQYREAIGPLQEAVELDAMPEQAQQNTMYMLASMYATEEDWTNVVRWLDRWFERECDPKPEALITAAQSRAQMADHRDAIPFVKAAIAKNDKPVQNWYQLWLAMHYELNEYAPAAEVLERMIEIWPQKKVFWEQLASLYMELKEDQKALATQALAYRNGLLQSEEELMNLVRMYMFMEIPYEAGQVLEKGMREGKIESNLEHLELLASAWVQSRENDRAIAALERAAQYADDGEHYIQIARLHREKGKWREIIDAVDKAMEKGDIERPGAAYLLQGMAATELKRYQEALTYFTRALNDDRTRAQAREWMRYAQEEIEVRS